MMRIFATLTGFVLFGAGIYLVARNLDAQKNGPEIFHVAFGPASETVEFEVPVSDLYFMKDPMGPGTPWGNARDWTDDHIELFDASGTKLQWQRIGHPRHISGSSASVSDSFMIYQLKPGQTYTLKYTPNIAEGVTYAREIVASSDELKRKIQLELQRQ